jgi:hypothetical protein
METALIGLQLEDRQILDLQKRVIVDTLFPDRAVAGSLCAAFFQ